MEAQAFDAQTLIALFGLIGAVIVGGTLLSGPTERTGLPALAIFLLLGLLLGPAGLGLISLALDDPLLRIVATLSLTLVLFTDAMTLDLQEVRRNKAYSAKTLRHYQRLGLLSDSHREANGYRSFGAHDLAAEALAA